jgi:hypothetical protein
MSERAWSAHSPVYATPAKIDEMVNVPATNATLGSIKHAHTVGNTAIPPATSATVRQY